MIELALKAYRQRLGNVRAELVSISSDLEDLAKLDRETIAQPTDEKTVEIILAVSRLARATRGLCGILVRVIDSLGK